MSQVLTKIFGDLTLVISFLVERFVLPLQMSSFTCSTVEGLPETPALCGSDGPGWTQSLSAYLALVLPWQHGFCRFQLTMGLMHPVRGWAPHVWKRRCGWLLGPGQAWTTHSLFKSGLPTIRLWAHHSGCWICFQHGCGLREAELGPLIPRLGVSQGLWD